MCLKIWSVCANALLGDVLHTRQDLHISPIEQREHSQIWYHKSPNLPTQRQRPLPERAMHARNGIQNAKKPNTQRKISDQSSHSIIPTVLFRFFPNSTTLGRSGCFTSTVLRTCRLAFDTLTCLATLTCTICLSKSSGDLTRR